MFNMPVHCFDDKLKGSVLFRNSRDTRSSWMRWQLGMQAGYAETIDADPFYSQAALYLHPQKNCSLIEKRIDEIQYVLTVHAEDATSSRAVTVDTEGSHAGNNVAATQKIRTARVAKTGATGMGIVR